MTSPLSRLAGFVGRRPRAASIAVLLALIALIGGGVAAGGAFKDDFTVPGIESQTAQDLLEQRFPAQSGTNAVVVFSSSGKELTAADLESTLAAIERQPHVVSVEQPFDMPDRVSEDGRTAFSTIAYDQDAT